MRKFIAGQSLHPVDGDIYVVTQDIGEPDRVVLFSEKITAETAANHPVDAEGKVEFVNRILAEKGLELFEPTEIQFLKVM
jgi:hypothetical protein